MNNLNTSLQQSKLLIQQNVDAINSERKKLMNDKLTFIKRCENEQENLDKSKSELEQERNQFNQMKNIFEQERNQFNQMKNTLEQERNQFNQMKNTLEQDPNRTNQTVPIKRSFIICK